MTPFSFALLPWIFGAAGIWLLPRSFQPYGMVAVTCAFLAIHSPWSLVLIAAVTGVSYFAPILRLASASTMIVAVTIIAVLLIYHKAGAGIDSCSELMLVPLGLSFYSLRAAHYSVDRYKGKLPSHGFGDFLAYLFFLPTLFAGPINRFQEFHRELQRRRWDAALVARGLERILYGFAKVVILGNYLVSLKLAQGIGQLGGNYPAFAAYLDCVRYGLNLYFQFSGYSDIAIGFALLLGIRIEENFRYPLLATNINDFWKRWHISLTSWCKDYIFMPAAAVSRRPLIAVMASMIVLGVWHEFSFRYLAWGLYHGAGIAGWHLFQQFKAYYGSTSHPFFGRVFSIVSWFVTMQFVILSFAITKEPDLTSALAVYVKVFSF